MEHSQELHELATALAKAQANIQKAHKSADNPFFNSTYADIAACWDACREPLSKEGLSVVQMPTTADGEVSVTTMLLHNSGQWIKETMSCKPAKNDAQAMGSVCTYLRRYMLMGAAGIAPADDDGNAAVKGGDKTAEQMTPTERKKAGLWGAQAKERGIEEPMLITALKKKITDFNTEIGKAQSQDAIVELTQGEYAEALLQCSEDLPDWYKRTDQNIQAALKGLPEHAEPETDDRAIPVPSANGSADWELWGKTLAENVNKAETPEEVDAWALANEPALTNLQGADEQVSAYVWSQINNRKQELEGQNNGI